MRRLQQLRHNRQSIYKSITLSPAGTSGCVCVCVCTIAFMGTPFICLHFSSVSSFFLFNSNSIRVCGVVWFSLVYHLLCRRVSPYVDARAGAPADAHVHMNVCVWVRELRTSAWALDCSSFQLDLFIFPSYLYPAKGSIPEGLWQFYSSDVCFGFLPRVLLSYCDLHYSLVWSGTNQKRDGRGRKMTIDKKKDRTGSLDGKIFFCFLFWGGETLKYENVMPCLNKELAFVEAQSLGQYCRRWLNVKFGRTFI